MIKSIKNFAELKFQEILQEAFRQGNEREIRKLQLSGASRSEIEELKRMAEHEYRQDDESIRTLVTRNLKAKANRLRLPLPNEEGDWEVGYEFEDRLLSNQGITKLRSAIRREISERLNFLGLPLKIASSMAP
ncbi:MAG: hypothetical protein P1V20_25765 [Verrucomicrobiales bacterium]|nr:hypothetical protein [Verrucomicrobiales bacterium]